MTPWPKADAESASVTTNKCRNRDNNALRDRAQGCTGRTAHCRPWRHEPGRTGRQKRRGFSSLIGGTNRENHSNRYDRQIRQKKARTPRRCRTVQPDHSADSTAYLTIQNYISPGGGMSSGIRGDQKSALPGAVRQRDPENGCVDATGQDGNIPSGSRTYNLNLPAGVPAKSFWGATAYKVADARVPKTPCFIPWFREHHT